MEANTISRSHSSQGLRGSNALVKIPLPPRLWWTTDVSNDSSDDAGSIMKDENGVSIERSRVRSRFRHHKQRHAGNVPIGIFWDIENCQVPRGCSAIDVVTTIRSKFLLGRREADFIVVCDVRKESPLRLQELNDAQVSLIHVCGTQKNAADDKLRQCMRRFGELHAAPAALLLVSGDINFAADLSDFRYRKNLEVILLHKQHTSPALIACATSHFCYSDLIAGLPRYPPKTYRSSQTEEDEEERCQLEVSNLPAERAPERVSRRLRRLADNCGGKVLRVAAPLAVIRFPTADHASRALKRMDGEDVFGYKIGTRLLRGPGLAYSSDEGYATAPPAPRAPTPRAPTPRAPTPRAPTPRAPTPLLGSPPREPSPDDWARALQLLPPPPAAGRAPPRRIRGTHGSTSLDQSAASSTNSLDALAASRAASPWNNSSSSASLSEAGDADDSPAAELTVTNLPPVEARALQEMLTQLFAQYVPVVRAQVWMAGDGPVGSVVFRSEWDARLAIARVHKRRLENHWSGRRLELSLGRPSPAPNLDVLRARLRAILLEQPGRALPLLRLRDAYASRHCCALTTSDISKVKDTVLIHEGFGRMVQLVDLSPAAAGGEEEAAWRCRAHAAPAAPDDGGRLLQPVFMDVATLAHHTRVLVESHGGMVPLLSFVECYEATFPPLRADPARGVPLELLLRSAPGAVVRDSPSRHVTWCAERSHTPDGMSSDGEQRAGRTAPALEPMLALFERELVDLLRAAPRATIPFSKLIPAFHHHFGRQCRVADYGFTKLPDLLNALSNTIVVLGTGSSRVITLSAGAQSRRWSSDLARVLRAQPGRAVPPRDLPPLYQAALGRALAPADYGVCTLQELMQKVSPQAVVFGPDGSVSLPRRTPTPEEKARTIQFAAQAMELLCYTPNLRMEFARFVPAYHAHHGRQLRVAHYGCVKLAELFELIPDAVRVTAPGDGGEREVRLALRTARAVVGQRLLSLAPLPLGALCAAHVAQYGAVPQPDMLDVGTLEELVLAGGGAVVAGEVRAPGAAPAWVSLQLAAAAALAADRSVRGSGEDYLRAALGPSDSRTCVVARLAAAGVLSRERRRVRLRPAWRGVLRAALLLPRAATAAELRREYARRYEAVFPSEEIGFENIVELMRHYREVFTETDGRWSLAPGVAPPPAAPPALLQDFSLHDTPPGQKGSRVFESPKVSLWNSPPASALPTPSALLYHDVKRRTRLAAQFNAV